jgi:hypothetical protein
MGLASSTTSKLLLPSGSKGLECETPGSDTRGFLLLLEQGVRAGGTISHRAPAPELEAVNQGLALCQRYLLLETYD